MLPILSLLLGCGDAVVVADYLTVIHIAPSNGAANIGQETQISATFNDDLVQDSWIGAVYLDDATGNPVPATLSYDTDGRTLSLAPDAPLERAATYSFTLTDTLAGERYGGLPANISTQFRVAGAGLSSDNQRPVALIDPPGDCDTYQELTLTQSSTDPEGQALTWAWRVVTGPAGASLSDPEADTVEFFAELDGTYTLGLVVDDGEMASNEAYVSFECDGGALD